ncbi:10145_t:CDS:1, partial [Ambispora gerdemannii]
DCPTYFNVKQCTPCQTTYYQLIIPSVPGDLNSTLTCDHLNRFINLVNAENATKPLKTEGDFAAVNIKFCKLSNPCPSNVSISGYQKLQKDCAKEIASIYLVQAYFWIYYYAAPDYQNLCLQSSIKS